MQHVKISDKLSSFNQIESSLSQTSAFPEIRYMGSKRRLLPWIFEILGKVDFETAIDPFSGSGAVSYLLKAMNKQVASSDFLNLSNTITAALVENNTKIVEKKHLRTILRKVENQSHFIEDNFEGVFFKNEDLKFLDRVSHNLLNFEDKHIGALIKSALIRSCAKRQPRGVFTISGDLSKYDDGRRDLRLSVEEHFFEQIETFNASVFNNWKNNVSAHSDAFCVDPKNFDLVYLDPPYVPRSDDNCYVKRYHFLEGLSCYWQGLEIDYSTKVRKIPKKYTPFSYRRTAIDAFNRLFCHFKNQKIALSYSSNGYPDLEKLIELLEKYKKNITVHKKDHRYHFGTHSNAKRTKVEEYLIIGQ
ncbi:MAG: DNA adenine methylase [Sneathiellales bacterium]|nr:DNA adenine methylase [Sneathiellales bacterium]